MYYTTNGKFRLKKKLNSGKSTRIAITKTTTLSVYAVQKGKKVTAAQLNSKKIKKKASYKNYYYKITTGSANPEASSNTSTAGTTTSPSASAKTTATLSPAASAKASKILDDTASPAATTEVSKAPDDTTNPAASPEASKGSG